jgi:hypothetical protein
MNPSIKPPKKGLGLPGGTKLAFAAGGGVLVVIALFVILSFTSRGSSNPALTHVAQEQAELSRVAGLHYGDVKDPATKNFVITTQLSLASAKADYLKYLGSNGVKIDDKQVALGLNAQTDAALDSAQTSGTLDSTVRTTLQTQLQQYQQTIQSAYKASSNDQTKSLLQDFFDQAKLLLEQSKS